jgi:hypothetical protein
MVILYKMWTAVCGLIFPDMVHHNAFFTFYLQVLILWFPKQNELLYELELLSKKKPIFTKKKICRLPPKCCRGIHFFPFNLETFIVRAIHILMFFRLAPKQKLGFFEVFKSLKIAKLLEIELDWFDWLIRYYAHF